jgi:amino acid adenylation domain-containing protein
MAEPEVAAWYARLNRTRRPFALEEGILPRIAARVEERPGALAISAAGRSLSYREYWQQSGNLAGHLAARGASQARPVAVCLPRTCELPVALLAAIRAGSYYIPLDPTHPPQRLAAILEESRPAVVLVENAGGHALSGAGFPLLELSEDLLAPAPEGRPPVQDPVPPGPEDLAYTIYTSGSTGRPKGVQICHAGLTNLLLAMEEQKWLAPGGRMAALVTIAFDLAEPDMYLPFLCGASLHMASEEMLRNPVRLAEFLAAVRPTLMQTTPTAYRLLLEVGWRGDPDLVAVAGGEPLTLELYGRLIGCVRELWNLYGPTETTVWSSMLRMQAGDERVRVGGPMANTTFYVATPAGRLLPPGIQGELSNGGVGVARGYVEREELTREKFVTRYPALFPPSGERVFRTGDLARLTLDGRLDFYGRMDNQVKLRGYRIELGEIEAAMRRFPGVEEAVVVLSDADAGEPGEPALVAHFVAGVSIPTDALRTHLEQQLPAYMVPGFFLAHRRLPVSASGKIDRRALGALGQGGAAAASPPAAGQQGALPDDPLTAEVLGIFRQMTGRPQLGPDDSFFDFGGYSLLAVRLFQRLNRAFSTSLPISAIFEARTASAMAALIRNGKAPGCLVPLREEGRLEPLFLVHSYLLYARLLAATDADRPLFGVREPQGIPVSVDRCAQLYAPEIIARAAGRRIHLLGWCAAAPLTVEVARRLKLAGLPVGAVILLDVERPGYRPATGRLRHCSNRVTASVRFQAGKLLRGPLAARAAHVRGVVENQPRAWLEIAHRLHPPTAGWLARNIFPAEFDEGVLHDMAATALLEQASGDIYPGHLHLVRALDVPQVPGEATLGWKEIARGGVTVSYAQGDHESMFRERNQLELRTLLEGLMTA